MQATIIIPARYASTRLPGKPLLAETGKPLIQHVVEAVREAPSAGRVVVATDDERIARAVAAFGGQFVMTRTDHRSGSDRLAEAAGALGLGDDQIVVNVQGDEPEIPPHCVDRLVELLENGDRHRTGEQDAGSEPVPIFQQAPMATLLTALPAEAAGDRNRVKCVTDSAGRALYFSRAPIPFDRDGTGGVSYKLHLGIYAYRAGFLRRFTQLAPTPAEKAEKLEQLRALEHGYSIMTAEVQYDGAGIDTPEDYAAFVRRVRGQRA
jgi:3-deoxy-manno-octulosonate cytidylyltransferase (CMP-KDO synthetase)